MERRCKGRHEARTTAGKSFMRGKSYAFLLVCSSSRCRYWNVVEHREWPSACWVAFIRTAIFHHPACGGVPEAGRFDFLRPRRLATALTSSSNCRTPSLPIRREISYAQSQSGAHSSPWFHPLGDGLHTRRGREAAFVVRVRHCRGRIAGKGFGPRGKPARSTCGSRLIEPRAGERRDGAGQIAEGLKYQLL